MDRSSPESLIHFLDNATSSVRAVLNCSLRATGDEELQEDVSQKNAHVSSPSRIRRKAKAQPRRRLKRFYSQQQGSLHELLKECSSHPQTVNDILRLSEHAQGDYQNGYTTQWTDRFQVGTNSNRDYEDGQGYHREWQGQHNAEQDMNPTRMYPNVQNISPDSNRSIDEYFSPPSNPQTIEDVANMMPVGCHLPPPLPSAYSFTPVRMSQEKTLQKMLPNMKDANLAFIRQDNPRVHTLVSQGSSDCGNVRDLLSELVSELEKTDAFDVLTGKVPSYEQQTLLSNRTRGKKQDEKIADAKKIHNSLQMNNLLNLKSLTFANESDFQETVNVFQDTQIGTMNADTHALTSYDSRRNVTTNEDAADVRALSDRNTQNNTDFKSYNLSSPRRDKIRQLKQLHEQKSMPNIHLFRQQQSVDSESCRLHKDFEDSLATHHIDVSWRNVTSDSSHFLPDQTPRVFESWMLNGHQTNYSNDQNLESNDSTNYGPGVDEHRYGSFPEDGRKTSVSVDNLHLIPANFPHVDPEWASSSSLDHVRVQHCYTSDTKQDLHNQNNMKFGKGTAMTDEFCWKDVSNSDMSLYRHEQQQQQRCHLQQQQQQQTQVWNSQAEITQDSHPCPTNTKENGFDMSCRISRPQATPPAFFPSSFHSSNPQLNSDLNHYDRVDVCMSPPATDTESYWSEEDEQEDSSDENDGGDTDADCKDYTSVDWKVNLLPKNYNLPVDNPVQQLPSFAMAFLH